MCEIISPHLIDRFNLVLIKMRLSSAGADAAMLWISVESHH